MGQAEVEDPGKDRLLPGEATSLHSGNLDDARLWVRVYAELTGFKDVLLAQVREQGRSVTEAGQPEVENDTKLLEREAKRLKRRLMLWQHELDKRETRSA